VDLEYGHEILREQGLAADEPFDYDTRGRLLDAQNRVSLKGLHAVQAPSRPDGKTFFGPLIGPLDGSRAPAVIFIF